MKKLYLSCMSDGIQCIYGEADIPIDKRDKFLCKDRKEFMEFVRSHPYDICLCSSSMDFPEEETDRRDIVELCNKIRSN